VIEKHAPRRRQFDAARAASEQLHAELQLEIVELAAQRRLCRMQPPLRCDRHAPFLGHRDEIPEMP
jgi:hypothetical protein